MRINHNKSKFKRQRSKVKVKDQKFFFFKLMTLAPSILANSLTSDNKISISFFESIISLNRLS
ncbi:MAG: hypothetical protein A2391_03110 [Candidatus Brennerbacteria bacterium RIFOXYB1_FULL_41_13]|nr:MAG: hypothetical protein A2391_03110 [Candidatus Brennerbacteria bacterium RIFOXYB1_FULL_41_13]